MSFLNAALLAGTLACTIPVIIHLLNRSRFRVVRWGAMHLLDPVIRVNRKRVRIEQLILLLIRVSIPLLLALLMARPVITGWRALSKDAKSSLVVMLDNSYSMEAGGGQSNLAEAQQQAADVVSGLPRGSDVSVVLMAGGRTLGSQSPTSDLRRAAGELTKLRGGYGAADVSESIETAIQRLKDMRHAKRDLVVVSDFQAVDWSEEDAPSRARLMELIESLPVTPTITFFQVGKEATDNVSVTGLDLSRFVVGVGQSVQVRANIRNHGSKAYPDLRVHFRVNGAVQSVAEAAVGPQEDAQVLFAHTFTAAGSHVVEAFIEADPLQADNRALISVPVWDRIPVLLVDGAPGARPLQGASDFLALALQPFNAGGVDTADLVDASVIEVERLNAKSLADQRVTVLANVRELSDEQVTQLEQFVSAGNALVVFTGDRVRPDWYNRVLHADGEGLLPLPLGEIAGGGQTTAIVAQHYEHPALELFNDPRNGTLADAEFTAWFILDEGGALGVSGAGEGERTVLARFDTGTPFLAEHSFGRGRVLLCASACDDDWSDLPMRPFFLPLMQRLMTYAAAKGEPARNVEVGSELVAFLPRSLAGMSAVVTDADGRRRELPIEDQGQRGVAEWALTDRPGLYVFETPDGDQIHFTVNTSRHESDLKLLDEDALDKVANEMSANVVRNWEQYEALDASRRYGREVWRNVFWAMLALVFAEMALQQLFTRKKV